MNARIVFVPVPPADAAPDVPPVPFAARLAADARESYVEARDRRTGDETLGAADEEVVAVGGWAPVPA